MAFGLFGAPQFTDGGGGGETSNGSDWTFGDPFSGGSLTGGMDTGGGFGDGGYNYSPNVDWSGGGYTPSLGDYFGGSGGENFGMPSPAFGEFPEYGGGAGFGEGAFGLGGYDNYDSGGFGGIEALSGFNEFSKSKMGRIALGLLSMANPALGMGLGLASAAGSAKPGQGIGSILGSLVGSKLGIPGGIGSMIGGSIGSGQAPSGSQIGGFAGGTLGSLFGPAGGMVGSQLGSMAGSFGGQGGPSNMVGTQNNVMPTSQPASGIGGMDGALLGLGSLYANHVGNKEASGANKIVGNAVKQNNGLTDLYGSGSPYAKELRQQLERRDAAAGRRSQYGPREVELQAKLAQLTAQQQNNQAQNNIQLGQLKGQLGQQKYGRTNSNLAQLAALLQMTGGTKGLASMFGGGQQDPQLSFDTNFGFGDAGYKDPFQAFPNDSYDPLFGG